MSKAVSPFRSELVHCQEEILQICLLNQLKKNNYQLQTLTQSSVAQQIGQPMMQIRVTRPKSDL